MDKESKGAMRYGSRIVAQALFGALALAVLPASAGEHDHQGMHDAHGTHHGHALHQDHAAMEHGMLPVAPPAITRTTASYPLPEVILRDANNEPVSLRKALDGAAVMVNFIFTSCTTVCPPMTATFAEVRQQLAADGIPVRMVSISIDPEYDTPARLKEYAARIRAGADWQFLTGSVSDIQAVQRAFAAYRGNKMNHAPLTLLRAAGGSSWVRVEGFASAADLAAELRRRVPREVALGR